MLVTYRPISITLESEHLAFCTDKANKHLARARKFGAQMKHSEEGFDAPFRGACGECAAFLWLRRTFPNIKWHHDVRFGVGRPDISTFIDVKTRNRDAGWLILEPKQPDEWAYLMVSGAHHPEYRIYGWEWGCAVKQHGFQNPNFDNWYCLDHDRLRPPETLIDEIQKRNGG